MTEGPSSLTQISNAKLKLINWEAANWRKSGQTKPQTQVRNPLRMKYVISGGEWQSGRGERCCQTQVFCQLLQGSNLAQSKSSRHSV